MRLFQTSADKEVDKVYTKTIGIPQYTPDGTKPNIAELYNTDKYSKLVRNIKNSSVSEEEKKFLLYAASRHIVFNYSKAADYYAHATPEMQELMEESALVILDIDDAMANGYIKLSKEIRAILEQSGEIAGDEK